MMPAIVQSVRIARLEGDASGFAGLTFPRLAKRLCPIDRSWSAIGAWHGDEPAGLLLGRISDNDPGTWVASVAVLPRCRRMGVGRRLLEAFEAESRARGRTSLHIRFAGRLPARASLERMLTSGGWPAPILTELSLFGEAGRMAASGGQWRSVRAMLEMPRPISFEPWRPLTAIDRREIEQLTAQPSYHSGFAFSPFEATLDPVCSVQVRRDGHLIGWIVATPASDKSAFLAPWRHRILRQYQSAYIEEALWRSGILVAGYYHAFTRQGLAYGETSIAHYFTAIPGQMALTRRRFQPIALKMDEIYTVQKRL